jgi:hypothetical protein
MRQSTTQGPVVVQHGQVSRVEQRPGRQPYEIYKDEVEYNQMDLVGIMAEVDPYLAHFLTSPTQRSVTLITQSHVHPFSPTGKSIESQCDFLPAQLPSVFIAVVDLLWEIGYGSYWIVLEWK